MVTKEKLLALIEEDALEDVMDVLGEWENLSKSNREKLSILKGRLAKDNNTRFEGTHTSDTERNAIRKELLRFVNDLFKEPAKPLEALSEKATISTLERVFYWAAIIGLIGFGYYLWTEIKENKKKIDSIENGKIQLSTDYRLQYPDTVTLIRNGRSPLFEGKVQTILGPDIDMILERASEPYGRMVLLKWNSLNRSKIDIRQRAKDISDLISQVKPPVTMMEDRELDTSFTVGGQVLPQSMPVFMEDHEVLVGTLDQCYAFIKESEKASIYKVWSLKVREIDWVRDSTKEGRVAVSVDLDWTKVTDSADYIFLDSMAFSNL